MKVYEDGKALQSKKINDWNSSDFYTMIKFKQLFKDNMPSLPTNLIARKQRWFSVCQHMEDPPLPQPPENYIELDNNSPSTPIGQVATARGDSDDDMSELSFEMFAV